MLWFGRGLIATAMGPMFILLSFVVIFVNEGRDDLSWLAEKSVAITEATSDDLVFVEGEISAVEPIGDGIFLTSGDYLFVSRVVESFSEGRFTGDDNEWKKVARDEVSFSSEDFFWSFAKIQNYWVDTKVIDFPRGERVPLDVSRVNNILSDKIVDNYIYLGTGTLAKPNLGDQRVSYLWLSSPQNDVTILGGVEWQKIVPYAYGEAKYLYRVFLWDKDDAILLLHGEYKSAKRGMRVLWFVLMWIGIWSLTALVRMVVRFIPIVGGITRVLLWGISFVVAMVLTYIAVSLGAIAHSWIALWVIGLLLGWLVFWMRKKKKTFVKKK